MPRQDTETKDRPSPKQTYPFEGTVLSNLPPFLTNLALCAAVALGVSHSNYVDFRRTSEREQTVHQIGKEQPSLRVCSRDLTIPRRDAPTVSWISTSYEKPVPKNAGRSLSVFKRILRVRRENLSLTWRFRSSQNCHLTLSFFEEFDTFTLCPKATTVCGKLAVPRSYCLRSAMLRTKESELNVR